MLKIIESAVIGIFGTIAYIITSHELDKVMSYKKSNAIGLIVDMIVNFFFQEYVFIGKRSKESRKFMIKFFIANLIGFAFAQTMFIIVHDFIEKSHSQFFKDEFKYHVVYFRYAIDALTYLVISYPMRKYFVFKKNANLKL